MVVRVNYSMELSFIEKVGKIASNISEEDVNLLYLQAVTIISTFRGEDDLELVAKAVSPFLLSGVWGKLEAHQQDELERSIESIELEFGSLEPYLAIKE